MTPKVKGPEAEQEPAVPDNPNPAEAPAEVDFVDFVNQEDDESPAESPADVRYERRVVS